MPKKRYKVTVWVTVDESQDGAPRTTNSVAWNIEAALKDDKTKRLNGLEMIDVTTVAAMKVPSS